MLQNFLEHLTEHLQTVASVCSKSMVKTKEQQMLSKLLRKVLPALSLLTFILVFFLSTLNIFYLTNLMWLLLTLNIHDCTLPSFMFDMALIKPLYWTIKVKFSKLCSFTKPVLLPSTSSLIETSHLVWIANIITSFYMKCNSGFKWIKI